MLALFDFVFETKFVRPMLPEEHYVDLWAMNGVVHPPSALLHA